MCRASEIEDEAGKDMTPFRAWCDNSGFWSDFGYDGLSLVFDVPLVALQKLPKQEGERCFACWPTWLTLQMIHCTCECRRWQHGRQSSAWLFCST